MLIIINGDVFSAISYSLSNLLSVLEHLELSWARAFLRRTRFMDPDFQGDVLAVICTFNFIYLCHFLKKMLNGKFSYYFLLLLLFLFGGNPSYDLFVFAYGITSPTDHALSAFGSVLTSISWS